VQPAPQTGVGRVNGETAPVMRAFRRRSRGARSGTLKESPGSFNSAFKSAFWWAWCVAVVAGAALQLLYAVPRGALVTLNMRGLAWRSPLAGVSTGCAAGAGWVSDLASSIERCLECGNNVLETCAVGRLRGQGGLVEGVFPCPMGKMPPLAELAELDRGPGLLSGTFRGTKGSWVVYLTICGERGAGGSKGGERTATCWAFLRSCGCSHQHLIALVSRVGCQIGIGWELEAAISPARYLSMWKRYALAAARGRVAGRRRLGSRLVHARGAFRHVLVQPPGVLLLNGCGWWAGFLAECHTLVCDDLPRDSGVTGASMPASDVLVGTVRPQAMSLWSGPMYARGVRWVRWWLLPTCGGCITMPVGGAGAAGGSPAARLRSWSASCGRAKDAQRMGKMALRPVVTRLLNGLTACPAVLPERSTWWVDATLHTGAAVRALLTVTGCVIVTTATRAWARVCRWVGACIGRRQVSMRCAVCGVCIRMVCGGVGVGRWGVCVGRGGWVAVVVMLWSRVWACRWWGALVAWRCEASGSGVCGGQWMVAGVWCVLQSGTQLLVAARSLWSLWVVCGRQVVSGWCVGVSVWCSCVSSLPVMGTIVGLCCLICQQHGEWNTTSAGSGVWGDAVVCGSGERWSVRGACVWRVWQRDWSLLMDLEWAKSLLARVVARVRAGSRRCVCAMGGSWRGW
jgi:hypothetical protein